MYWMKRLTIMAMSVFVLVVCGTFLNACRPSPTPKINNNMSSQKSSGSLIVNNATKEDSKGTSSNTHSATDTKSFVQHLVMLAKLGKSDQSPFIAGKSNMTLVKKRWGTPDSQNAAGKGTYATYRSKKAAFGFNQNGLIFDVRSYSKPVQSLSQSEVRSVLGQPQTTTNPTAQQVNDIYKMNNTYQLEFIINTVSSEVDHISIFDASAVNSHPTHHQSNSPRPSKIQQPTDESQAHSQSTPLAPIRGVIEGFYGTPWSHDQRINMFHFMDNEHLNTYVYAPKDDPYQRLNWRSPYPASELAQMGTLVANAKKDHVNFVYSISPGMTGLTSSAINKSITYSSQADRQTLEAKIDQLRSIGVHTFMLSFDDIKTKLKSTDRRVYGTDYPKAQMQVANHILKDEKAKDPSFQLWFVPTSYYGLTDGPYWRTLRSVLNTNIQVIWTGKWVLNHTITRSQAQTITKLFGRKPILWDNYPVNDYTYAETHKPQLLMGPLEGRSASLVNNIAGYISNPMIEPSASKLALETISDYLQHPNSYQPRPSWDNAIKNMPGITEPSLFKIFAEYNTSSILNSEGYSPIKSMVAAYQNASTSSKKQIAEKALDHEFTILDQLPSTLPPTITDKELLQEIEPWLTKLGEEGQGGLDALAYLNHPNQKNKQELTNQIKKVTASSYKIGDNIITFMKWAEKQ